MSENDPEFQAQVAAIANQQPQPGGYGTPAIPQAPQAINPGGAQLGSGLQMPTMGQPGPIQPRGPINMPPQNMGQPMAKAADLAANARTAEAAKHDADEKRRAGTIKDLEAMGARPGTADRDATKIDRQAGAGVPNPYAAAPQGGGGGGPAAAPFDQTKAGYEAMGVNPNDPRQLAATQGAAEQAKASQELAARQSNEAYQQGRAQQAASFGQADQMREDAALEAKHRADDAAAAKPHLDRYMRLQQDLAAEKIDPDLIYRGTAGGVRRVTSALGVALGAIGAVYGHTENFAQKIVEQQVNNSIDAQKANLANKRQVAENEKGVYTMFREQGADDATARSATRALAYSAAAKDAEGIASGLKNEDQRRAADMQAQQMRAAGASAEQDFTMKANANGYAQAEARRKEAAAAAASKGSGEDAKDVSGDLAATWIKDHPDEVKSAYSSGGKFWNWLADKTGIDFDANENKAARRHVEEVVGGQMVGRVNDERLERHEKKFEKSPEDIENLANERLTSAEYKRRVKLRHDKGAAPGED